MLLWYRREAPVEYQPAAGAMEGVLAKINAALRTAAPQVNEAWKPIETAPKDGTPILLFRVGKVCFGAIKETVFDGLPLRSERVVVPTDDGTLAMPMNDPTEATHWQPLPEPPALNPIGERDE
jgi:hypothetical protein